MTSQGTTIATSELCPTHKVEMVQGNHAGGRWPIKFKVCLSCQDKLALRTIFIKYKIERLKRSHWLAENPKSALLFEGL